jgi:hypothetical protein
LANATSSQMTVLTPGSGGRPHHQPQGDLEADQQGVRRDGRASGKQEQDQTGQETGHPAHPVRPEDGERHDGERGLHGEEYAGPALPRAAPPSAGVPPGQHVQGHDERDVGGVRVRKRVERPAEHRARQHHQHQAP